MMGTKMIKQLRDAISNLNPQEVREIADRPVSITLVASSIAMYEEMEAFFAPVAEVSPQKRSDLRHILKRAGTEAIQRLGDTTFPGAFEIYEEGISHPNYAFVYHPSNPQRRVARPQRVSCDAPAGRAKQRARRRGSPRRVPRTSD